MSDLPAGWAEAALGDLGIWVGGTTPSKSNPAFWEPGTTPWASPKDMKRDLIIDTEDRVSEVALDRGAAVLVPAGSVLVVTRSGILQHSVPTAVAGVDLAINQDIKALIPAAGINPMFVAEQLRAAQNSILEAAAKVGATVESLDLARLSAFKIRLAPEREQHRIVERLKTIKGALARSRAELQRIDNLVASTRGAIVERELSRTRQANTPGQTPSSVRLSDIITAPIRNGLSVRGNSQPPGVRALKLSALRSHIVDVDDVRYLPIGLDEAEKFSLEPGDVLISRGSGTRGFVGLGSVVPDLDDITIFPDTAFRVRLDQDRVLPEWFVAAWNAPSVRVQIARAARTTAGIWKVSQRDLASISLELPRMRDQLEIVERLRDANSVLDKIIEKRGRAERLLTRTEEAITKRAFAGRLVKRIEGEGSAVDLLESIKAAPPRERPRRTRPRMPTKTTREHLEALLADWPAEGRSFEQLRQVLVAPYEEIRTAIYDLLESGRIAQRFDPSLGLVQLVRSS